MNKQNCIICDAELVWGKFAYNQEMCWDCFIFETKTMVELIDRYPPSYSLKRELHKDILRYLVAVVGELYGYIPRK